MFEMIQNEKLPASWSGLKSKKRLLDLCGVGAQLVMKAAQ